jgi:hypothetical protein
MREHLRQQHVDLSGGGVEIVDLLAHFGLDFTSD